MEKKAANLLIAGDKVIINPFVGIVEVDEITTYPGGYLCLWILAGNGKLHPVGAWPTDLVNCVTI
jgi:hypothetical protein